ncbi:four helix bundle protein [Pseudarcicella hirudinis]|uniref:Four helix bundle protein n=1 Tax=Pseudarcicella hirudinis TaxID=1079859 RepID=A0A1I5QZM7_9BACT|nr:four helix bundle protein [Pseudarcicella hirudinis]SFP51580.1 four helix bundle protein [Pseudarcicella hirudinis]
MRDFRKYTVWEQGHKLVLELYRITKTFPAEEKFGLTSQIRRSGISIPTNIAEGCGKPSEKDFARFLGISFGSCQEIEYLMLLARDLDYLNEANYDSIFLEIVSIKKQLYHLIKKLNAES